MPTEGQIREFCTDIDKNQDGKVSKSELTIFIRKMLS